MTAPTENDRVDDVPAPAEDGAEGSRARPRRGPGSLRRAPGRLVDRLLPARRSVRTAVVVVLAVLVLAAGVGAGLLASAVADDRAREEAAGDGLRAAADLTPVLLSYDWRTIDADAARIDGAGTGAFAEENRAIMEGLVKPAAVEAQAVSRAGVSATALVSAEPGRTVALVYFTQTTTLPSLPGPRIDGRSARVTIEQVDDGRWLVSGFDAV